MTDMDDISRDGRRPLAVVLASGGMDSCVTIAIAAERYELALLHVNYGQRTEARELSAFVEIAEFYRVAENRRLIVSLAYLARIGGSSLTDRTLLVPDAGEAGPGIPNTYVPFRNGNMLGIAASWAEVLGADAIFIGAVEEDSSGYPDCREVFYRAWQRVMETGTKNEKPVRIVTPLIHLRKREIVEMGMRLGAPLALSWSCYSNEEQACGRCESCHLRLRGFQEAGYTDPISYEA
jgi:7-cyano-7-deazaguanine synthase